MKAARTNLEPGCSAPGVRRAWVEEIEPRILYSADIAPLALDQALAHEAAEQRVLDAQGEFASETSSSQPLAYRPSMPAPSAAPLALDTGLGPTDPGLVFLSRTYGGYTASAAPEEPAVSHDSGELRPSGQHLQERTELAFIDRGAEDYETLLGDLQRQGLDRELEVVLLDPTRNGIEQITEALALRRDLDAVHIFSHGADGKVVLGNTALERESLLAHADLIQGWGRAFTPDADLLIYGCDVARTEAGTTLVQALARLTGADVAASTDPTGSEHLGGDWDLEFRVGKVETLLLAPPVAGQQWAGLLAQATLVAHAPAFSDMSDTGYELKADQSWGQTFRYDSSDPSYTVNRVEVVLSKAPLALLQVITVSLRETWNGPALGSASLTSLGLATSEQWYAFDIGNVTLNDNQTYYLRVDSDLLTGLVYVGVRDSGSYPDGHLVNTSGSAEGGKDAAFRVIGEVNTAPSITSDGAGPSASISVIENTTAVTVVTAGDVDVPAQTLTFSISGGADAARFSIDGSSGALSFVAAPDFEAPLDADANNVYHVSVQVSDGSLTDTQDISVTVVDAAMLLDQFNAVSYAGNDGTQNWSNNWQELGESDGPSSGVARVASGAFRMGGDEVTISGRGISREADLSGATSAMLSYSYRRVELDDDGGGNVQVQVSGNGGSSWTTLAAYSLSTFDASFQSVSFDISAYAAANTQVRVVGSGSTEAYFYWDDVRIEHSGAAANTPPVIVSDGGGDSAAITIAENSVNVTVVTATDIDTPAQPLTYSILGGTDQSLFAIDSASGLLRFVSAPDAEAPADADGDGVYEVTVGVADTAGGSDEQTILVTVSDVNEAPTASDDVYAAIEDTALDVMAPGVLANDSDVDGDALSALLVTGPGNGSLTLNSDGSFTYVPAPDFSGTDSFTYKASDGVLESSVHTVTLNVSAVNDAPMVSITGGTAFYTENSPAIAAAPALIVTDVDSPLLDHAHVRISAGYAAGQDVLSFVDQLGITGAWDAAAGQLTLTGSASVADYQTALRSITYRNTSDNPAGGLRTVTFEADDGQSAGFASRDVFVTPVNDAPVIGNNSGSVIRGQTITVGSSVLNASDPDNTAAELVYTVTALPGAGSLRLSGVALGLNATFTQDDVNSARVSYAHGGGAGSSDVLTLSLSDGAGAALAGVDLTVAVGEPPPPPPVVGAPPPPPPPSGGAEPPADEGGSETADGGAAEDGGSAGGGSASGAGSAEGSGGAGGGTGGGAGAAEALIGPDPTALAESGVAALAPAAQGSVHTAGALVRALVPAGVLNSGPQTGWMSPDPDAPAPAVESTAPAFAVRTAALEVSEALVTFRRTLGNDEWVGELDRMRESVDTQIQASPIEVSTVAITGGLSVGYVLWLLRGGLLLSSLLSSLPAWTVVDPLPVLARGGQDDDDAAAEDDPLEKLFGRARAALGLGRGAAASAPPVPPSVPAAQPTQLAPDTRPT